MPKMDILLINPPSPYPASRFVSHPLSDTSHLGIGYLASVLKRSGFRVEGLNLYRGLESIDAFVAYLRRYKPVLVGFSAMTETYNNGVLVAAIVKQNLPESVIVFGGPHVTFLAEDALHDPNIDIVVRNEGEYTFHDLAKHYISKSGGLDDINGISYKSQGQIIHTPSRPFIHDLDELPFPVRYYPNSQLSPDPIKNTKVPINILTGRGCPAHCKFCAASAMSGGHRRIRTVNNVIAELQGIIRAERKHFVFFVDDTLTDDRQRLTELCAFLKSEKISWGAESRVDALTEDVAAMMARSGCKSLQFGVESGSSEMLQSMNKGIILNETERAIETAVKHGISVACSLMIGYPGETPETCAQTIAYAEKLQKQYGIWSAMAITQLYPGTYIYKNSGKLGLVIKNKNFNDYNAITPNFDSPTLSVEQLRTIYFDGMVRLLNSLPPKYQQMLSPVKNA